MRLVTAGEMRALDRHTIDVLGTPGAVLMERAGRAVALEVRHVAEKLRAGGSGGVRRFLAVAGAGNNGGDAYAAARILTAWGWDGAILECADPGRVRGDAETHRRRAIAAGVPMPRYAGPEGLAALLNAAAIVIDGMLGTGIDGEVREPFRSAIHALNVSRRPVVAVDIPSGLNADTGAALPEAVRADVTVTMGLPKLGLVLGRGPDVSGRIVAADIGIPRGAGPCPPVSPDWIAEEEAAAWIEVRRRTDHKGSFGHLLVVAGSVGCAGAAVMCAQGALRAGAGLVTVLVPDAIHGSVASGLPEAMVHAGPASDGRLDASAAPVMLECAARATALAIGPGLGLSPGVRAIVAQALRETSLPAVIDADGLNALGSPPEGLPRPAGACVITPHPGEMRRLVAGFDWAAGLDPAGRPSGWEVARKMAAAAGAVTVLKGAGTVVADPRDDSLSVNSSGNPGMAAGGSGDVLTGIIGGRLALGDDPARAARFGVYVHGAAGDLAAARTGETALQPTDLLEALPRILHRLETRSRLA